MNPLRLRPHSPAARAPPVPNQQIATLGGDGAHPVLELRQVRVVEVTDPVRLHSPRVRSDRRFSDRRTDYVSASGVQRMRGSTTRKCDRAPGTRPAWRPERRHHGRARRGAPWHLLRKAGRHKRPCTPFGNPARRMRRRDPPDRRGRGGPRQTTTSLHRPAVSAKRSQRVPTAQNRGACNRAAAPDRPVGNADPASYQLFPYHLSGGTTKVAFQSN